MATHKPPLAPELTKRIADAYTAGASVLRVAAQLRVSQDDVRRALAAEGVPVRHRGCPFKRAPDWRLPRLIEMRSAGATLDQMGAEYGITRERVRQIMLKAGIDTSHMTRPLTDEQLAAVKEYAETRGNLIRYAARFNVSDATFRGWVTRAGYVPHRSGGYRGERVAAMTKRVADLYLTGMTAKDIAKAVGLQFETYVYRYLAYAGIEPDRQGTKGSRKRA